MEYIIPTYQRLDQHFSMDAGVPLLPDETASSPKTTGFAFSKSSEARSGMTISSNGPATPGAAKPQLQRRSSHQSTNSRRSSFPTEGIVIPPWPLGALFTEYGYLIASFQQHRGWEAALVGQHVQAVASMQTLGAGKERRRLRKHLNLLKSKINEAVDQKNAVSNRLAEVCVDIESRKTQALDSIQEQRSMDGFVPPTPSTYGVTSPVCWEVTSVTTPLNASSPEFVPVSWFEDTRRSSCQEDSIHCETTLDTVVEEAEPALSCSPTQSLEGQVDDAVEMDEAEDDWVNAHLEAARARRLSLPCFQTSWP